MSSSGRRSANLFDRYLTISCSKLPSSRDFHQTWKLTSLASWFDSCILSLCLMSSPSRSSFFEPFRTHRAKESRKASQASYNRDAFTQLRCQISTRLLLQHGSTSFLFLPPLKPDAPSLTARHQLIFCPLHQTHASEAHQVTDNDGVRCTVKGFIIHDRSKSSSLIDMA